jgi:hypothetical protein
MRDDLIDLILRDELTARTQVSLLPARLALDAFPGQQLLGLARASARRC